MALVMGQVSMHAPVTFPQTCELQRIAYHPTPAESSGDMCGKDEEHPGNAPPGQNMWTACLVGAESSPPYTLRPVIHKQSLILLHRAAENDALFFKARVALRTCEQYSGAEAFFVSRKMIYPGTASAKIPARALSSPAAVHGSHLRRVHVSPVLPISLHKPTFVFPNYAHAGVRGKIEAASYF